MNRFADSDTHLVDAIDQANDETFQIWCDNATIEELQSALKTCEEGEQIIIQNTINSRNFPRPQVNVSNN